MILNRIQNFLRRLHPSTEFQNFTNNNNYINFSVILDSKVHNSCFFLFRPITINLHHKMSNEASGTNHLSLEKSPYLLQHSTNPVDWYPWGEEAFKKAQDENKLIFLSVGYSTCHWCHVMEKESFENVEVAEIMNKYFVNIKVDREERPDVDKIYMSFIQASYGSGGWPMSIFLTPNLEPVAGGTYFPPNDRYGQFGFKTVLENLADKWINKPNTLIKVGDQYIKSLQKSVDDAKSKFVKQIRIPRLDVEQRCLIQYSYAYDKQYGGFSSSPKFPQPSNFNLLFHIYSKSKHSEQGKECLKMCLFTLKKMAYGGIHDHVNSGFARYSVDRKWHIPHFEKMLYDQAQLAVSYADAYVLTKDEFYADTLNDILKYVSRDLSHPEGGFYGAEDADSYSSLNTSKKQEGAFCIWEYDEIVDILSARNFKIFEYHFNLKKTGNVDPSQDTHGEFVKKNVLACFKSYKDTAEKFQIDINDVKKILKECLGILYELRQKRPKPQVDTKILTSWNGLMISGYSKAGFILKNQSYIDRAIKAANFLRNNLCMEDDKLLRCCYGGEDGQVNYGRLKINGFLEDYAFLIRGLLDLYEACLDVNWLIWAEKLQEKQDQLFWDKENWGYFHWNSENYPNIVFTTKDYQDGAEPCGNSVSVHNLLKLSAYLDRNDFMLKASQTLTAFSERLTTIPIALPEMVSALLFYHNSPTQVFIAGKREDDNTEALLDVVRSKFMPGRILAVADELAGFLQQRHQTLARLKTIGGKSAAYVCRNFTCSLPVTEPEELSNYFDKNEFHKTN